MRFELATTNLEHNFAAPNLRRLNVRLGFVFFYCRSRGFGLDSVCVVHLRRSARSNYVSVDVDNLPRSSLFLGLNRFFGGGGAQRRFVPVLSS